MIDRIIDVGIITIIPTEIKALLSVFGITEEFKYSKQGDANYLKTEIYSVASGRKISIVVTFLNKESGNSESAIVTSRFLNDWYPRLMCLVGISAGIVNKAKIGDVIIPSKIHDRQIKVYKNGKYSPRTTTHIRSDFMDGIVKLRGLDVNKFRKLCKLELADDIANAIKARESLGMEYQRLNENIDILDGSLISDNVLIRDTRFFKGILNDLDEKCRGAEMEAAGFVRACYVENTEFPWIVSRGISDFGDAAKSDSFQLLAAKTACLALRELLINCIDINKMPENIHAQEFKSSFEFNIIQQIKVAYDNKNWNEVCRIAPILSRYLWLSGQHQLRVEIGTMVVEAAAYIEKNDIRSSYYIDDLGWTIFVMGNESKAKAFIRDGLRIANEIQNYYLSSKAHRHLASIYRRNHRIDDAKTELEKSVEDANKINDDNLRKEMMSSLLLSKAKLLFESTDSADKEKSIAAYEKALKIFIENNDVDRAVKVYALLGKAYQIFDRMDDAIEKYKKGLDTAYCIGRYDEIRANTAALLPLSNFKQQSELLLRIIEYCKTNRLYCELNFWQTKKEEKEHENRSTSFSG